MKSFILYPPRNCLILPALGQTYLELIIQPTNCVILSDAPLLSTMTLDFLSLLLYDQTPIHPTNKMESPACSILHYLVTCFHHYTFI